MKTKGGRKDGRKREEVGLVNNAPTVLPFLPPLLSSPLLLFCFSTFSRVMGVFSLVFAHFPVYFCGFAVTPFPLTHFVLKNYYLPSTKKLGLSLIKVLKCFYPTSFIRFQSLFTTKSGTILNNKRFLLNGFAAYLCNKSLTTRGLRQQLLIGLEIIYIFFNPSNKNYIKLIYIIMFDS